MKTKNNTLRKILIAGACFSVIALMNLSLAQPITENASSTPFASTLNSNTGDKTNAATVVTIKQEVSSSTDQMLNSKTYWVDYLNQETGNENVLENTPDIEDNQSLEKMETEPDYWPKYINNLIQKDTGTEVEKMENEPDFWINYLQSIISSREEV